MTKLPDEAERMRALTDLAATLLVEAAAGTGKTSLLAGRVLCLLASGVPPREMAAITFTEFAAGGLRERIARYLAEVLSGRVPDELRLAFPDGPTRGQRQALQEAAKRFDELTCTTIHGFCHGLLRIYAVEAAIDPGAEIIDRTQADLAFATTFERWLRDRLSGVRAASDPIARTAESDPINAEELLRELAEFRRAHRTARPLPARIEADADVALNEAVAAFRRWFNSAGGPAEAEQDLIDLEQLAQHFRGKFAPLPGFPVMERQSIVGAHRRPAARSGGRLEYLDSGEEAVCEARGNSEYANARAIRGGAIGCRARLCAHPLDSPQRRGPRPGHL